MGTYATFLLEKKTDDGCWDSVYSDDPEFITAHKIAESQDYFKYAFLSGVRNYYVLKEDMVPQMELKLRDEATQNSYREDFGLNLPSYSWGDSDAEEMYCSYEISFCSARALSSDYVYLDSVYLIDDLIKFDYTKEIEYQVNDESFYIDDVRYLEEKTYEERLGYFVRALKTLQSFGVDRILISYD